MDMDSYDESDNENPSYYEQDDAPSDYESENYDDDDDQDKPKLLVSSPENDMIGMTSLSKKSSPRPTQLLSTKASKESPWKTQSQMRVSLRAMGEKMEAERELKKQNEIQNMLTAARDSRMEMERKARSEKQEAEASIRLKERKIAEEKAAKLKARESATRFKAKKLETATELKRREDEAAAVKEARADRRKMRGYERKQELHMNHTNQVAVTPIKIQTTIPVPEKTEDDSDTDDEDDAELLALVQSKTPEVSSKSERITAERKAEEEISRNTKIDDGWTEVKTKKPKTPKPIIKMGQESYRPESRRFIRPSSPVPSHGSNKPTSEELQQRLVKTRFCMSIQNGIPCPHGKNCRFAHTVDELQLPTCLFGHKCNFVKDMGGGLFTNCGKKICKFIHSGESKDSYYKRVGIKPPPPISTQPKPIEVEPKPLGAEPKPRPRLIKVVRPPAPKPPAWTKPLTIPADDEISVSSSSTTSSKPLCKFVAQGKPCPHKKCRFPHTQNDNGPRVPTNITMAHPVVVPKPTVVEPKPTVVVPKPTVVEPKPQGAEPKPPPVQPLPLPPAPTQTIYVPESQYMVALEMAMKSGNSIRIEIAK
mgnify:CR=1 FL=1